MESQAVSGNDWEPVSFDIHEWQPIKQDGPPKEERDVAKDLTPSIEKLEKAHTEAIEEMKTVIADAIAEQTELTAGWMKKLESVLAAKRQVTVERDENGLAKRAVSEVVAIRS